MIGELHGPPVGNVAIFSFAKYSVEHSCRAEQSDMSAVQRSEWAASNVI
jgi:hypothetical protein